MTSVMNSLLSRSKDSTGFNKGHQSNSSIDSNNNNNYSSANNSSDELGRKSLSPSRVHGILINTSNRNPSPNNQYSPPASPSSPLNPKLLASNSGIALTRSISTPVGQTLTPPSSSINSASISSVISDPNNVNPNFSPLTHFPSNSSTTSSVPFPSGERGRSVTRPLLTSNHSTTSSIQTNGTTANKSIRFAPLPEIRPRSYSTGRNIWLEEADVTEENGGPRKYIRRESIDQGGSYDDGSAILDDDEEEERRGRGGSSRKTGRRSTSKSDTEESPSRGSLNLGRFGSWGSESIGLKSSGLSNSILPSSSSGEEKESGSGYSSLLGPLTFGLVKTKKSKNKNRDSGSNTSNRSESNTRRETSLSRVSSNESDISRRSSEQLSSSYNNKTNSMPNRKPTGVPLRKSRTWELGETQQQSRRAMYPPVAQRSKVKITPVVKRGPDPSFIEWGYSKAGAGGGGLGSVRSAGYVEAVDNNDGSGMEWVKRRRAEKEKKKKEEEEAEVERLRLVQLEGEKKENEVEILEGGGGVDEGLEINIDPPSATNSGTTTPLAKSSMLMTTRPALHLYTADSTPTDSLESSPITTSGPILMASALPKILTQAPTPSSATPSPTSTNPSSNEDETSSSNDDSHQILPLPLSLPLSQSLPNTPSTAITSLSISPNKEIKPHHSSRLSVDSFEMERAPLTDEDDEEEEEEEEEEEDEREGDSDLDDDELAEEEMLAEKARVTALSAGAERYHSANHDSMMRKVETAAIKLPSPKPL